MPETRTNIAKASRTVEPVKTSPLSKENNVLPNTFRAKSAGRVVGDKTNELADALGLASSINTGLATTQKLTEGDERLRGRAIQHRGGPKEDSQRGFLGRAVYGNTASDAWDDAASVKRSYEVHNEVREWYEQNKTKLSTEELSAGVSKMFSSALSEAELFGDRYVVGLGNVLSKSEAQFDAELKDLGVKRVTEAVENQTDGARSAVMKAYYAQDPESRDPKSLTASLSNMGKSAKDMGVEREKFNNWVAQDVYTKARTDGNPELIAEILQTKDKSGQSIFDRMTPEQRIMYDRNWASARVKQMSNDRQALTKKDKTASISKEAATQDLAQSADDWRKSLITLGEASLEDAMGAYGGRQDIALEIDAKIEEIGSNTDIKKTDRNSFQKNLRAYKRHVLEGTISDSDTKWIDNKINNGTLTQDDLESRMHLISTDKIKEAEFAVKKGEHLALNDYKKSIALEMKWWSSIPQHKVEEEKLTDAQKLTKAAHERRFGKPVKPDRDPNSVLDEMNARVSEWVLEYKEDNEGKRPRDSEMLDKWKELKDEFSESHPLPDEATEVESTEPVNPRAGLDVLLESVKDLSIPQAAKIIAEKSQGTMTEQEAKDEVARFRGLPVSEVVEPDTDSSSFVGDLAKGTVSSLGKAGSDLGAKGVFEKVFEADRKGKQNVSDIEMQISKTRSLTEKLLGFKELDVLDSLGIKRGTKHTVGQRNALRDLYASKADKLSDKDLNELVESIQESIGSDTKGLPLASEALTSKNIMKAVLIELEIIQEERADPFADLTDEEVEAGGSAFPEILEQLNGE